MLLAPLYLPVKATKRKTREILYAQELLKKGDYLGVGIAATFITTNVGDCVSSVDSPSFDKSKLPKYTAFIVKAADVIIIISKLLLKQ
ncbi:hypothetical protein RIF29_28702 [Crotalaria pallida]|uniref:Uncharacterized protein n=1 Tax=Crotalaria pallida TaxID=3830 RepID=A0AAN9HWS0_CROPI